MSLAVHVLTWIAFDRRGTADEVGTSQRIAASGNTNPVVIRRCLGELRQAGLVESNRTHGWALSRHASQISLHDAYRAEFVRGLDSAKRVVLEITPTQRISIDLTKIHPGAGMYSGSERK